MTLSLVEASDLDEKIAIDEVSRRLTDKCGEELHMFSQRMGFLLSDPDLQNETNPLSPELVIRALKVACEQMTSGYQTKLTVLRLFEQHIAAGMLNMYREINSHLVARSILPNIRPGIRKASTGVSKKTVPAAATADPPSVPDTALSPDRPAADVFATLQKLMSGGSMFDRVTSAGSSAPSSFGVNTDSFAPPPLVGSPVEALRAIVDGPPARAAVDLVASLTRMQQQDSSQRMPTPESVAPTAAANDSDVTPRNVLLTVRDQVVADGSQSNFLITYEIIFNI